MDGGSVFLLAMGLFWSVGGFVMMTQVAPGTSTTLCGICLIALGVATIGFTLKNSSNETQPTSQNNGSPSSTSNAPVRSQWEIRVARMVRDELPYGVSVIENDRSIIPGRNGGANLEIDIYIPSMRLGFEANGEKYHRHEAYRDDLRYGSRYSDERYKELECEKQSIELVHIWDSQSDEEIKRVIRDAIGRHRY